VELMLGCRWVWSNPCARYLPGDCEGFVLCVLQMKGYEIIEHSLEKNVEGCDIVARYPGGVYLYFIEVKCGPRARLSPRQRELKTVVDALRELGENFKYVVCQFDDRGRLLGDVECRKLLKPYI